MEHYSVFNVEYLRNDTRYITRTLTESDMWPNDLHH